MSFRDLRNMSEILRTVGYPRLISLENFRIPNFRLVADIGLWLVRQYEPKIDFPSSVETENDRVVFIRTFAEFIVTKVHVKLNTKRLYQADGYAVKELIKVASVLHSAMKEAEKIELGIVRTTENKNINFDVSANLDKLKRARALGSEITQRGVLLYDMLSKEVSLREIRLVVLTKAFELDEVERLIRSAVQSSQAEHSKYTSMISQVEGNINNLDIKIEKKKQEIERSEKRFQTLKKVRPAFMDEYERLQQELAAVYKRYVNRFRCLSYLQKQMEELNRLELERKAEERSLRQEGDDYFFMDKNSRGDMFGSGSDDDDDDSRMNEAFNKAHSSSQKQTQARNNSSMRDSIRSRGPNTSSSTNNPNSSNKSVRPQATAGSRNRTSLGRSRQIYGSMLGGGEESPDSESDMILVDGDGNSDLGTDDPDDDDDDDDEDLELHSTAYNMARSMGIDSHIQDHIMKQELKHANHIMHGVESTPPAPSASAEHTTLQMPSSANINNIMTNQNLGGGLQLKSPVPNGGLRNH